MGSEVGERLARGSVIPMSSKEGPPALRGVGDQDANWPFVVDPLPWSWLKSRT